MFMETITIETLAKQWENSTRSEVYKQVKSIIDAANKRLKRQGVNTIISTKGLDTKGLIDATKRALEVKYNLIKSKSINSENAIQNSIKQQVKAEISHNIRQLPNNFRELSRKELYKLAKPTIDAANKRLVRLGQSGLLSPAYYNAMDNGGKFTTKGLDRNELLKETSRAISFMNMKTSTIKGAREYENSINAKLSNNGRGLSNEQKKIIWDGFRKLEQVSPIGLNIYGSDRLLLLLSEELVSNDTPFDELFEKALSELNESYENSIKEMENDIDIWNL